MPREGKNGRLGAHGAKCSGSTTTNIANEFAVGNTNALYQILLSLNPFHPLLSGQSHLVRIGIESISSVNKTCVESDLLLFPTSSRTVSLLNSARF